jgi:hypothetical protein
MLPATLVKPPPEPAVEKTEHPKSTTDTGLPVEEQVRKEWDQSKDGLPTFLYRFPAAPGQVPDWIGGSGTRAGRGNCKCGAAPIGIT